VKIKKYNFYLLFILSFIFFNDQFINEAKSINLNTCNWDTNPPCLTISSKISNSSKISDTSINKIIISKKEIDQSMATDLVGLLKTIPGINITQSGPQGQQASIFMRGTGSNHTLVMINGVPINDQSTTQGLHDFGVDFLHTIQQIEIYPGSSSTHFGTNAIGGAVNIILDIDYNDSLSVNSDHKNNYNFFINKNFLNKDLSSFNFKFAFLNKEIISAKIGNDEKDKLENFTSNINYQKQINDSLTFSNTMYLRQTNSEYDNSQSQYEGYKSNNNMLTNQFRLSDTKDNKKNDLVIYFNTYDREYDEVGIIDEYKSNVVGAKIDSSKTYSDKFSLGYGADYKYDWGKFDNRGSYAASTKGDISNFALYTNFGWNIFTSSNISFFLRNDRHNEIGNNKTYKFIFNKELKNSYFGFATMSGLRNPTIYELYGTDNYGYSGNKDLKAEKSITHELYGNIDLQKNLNFSTTFFKSRIIDNIEYLNNQYVNDTDNIDLKQSGVNSELNFSLKKINLNLFSSFLSSKKENGSNQLRRPKKNYGFKILKKLDNPIVGKFNINLNYNHYGKHYDTHSKNFSVIEMDSTDIVDLRLSKKFFNTNFFLNISNLFNENYQRPHGYNQENRYINFGFKF